MENLVDLFGALSDSEDEALPASLPPEVEEGNIEYKRKLVNPSPSRLEHLTTQMKWRLQEGEGEAIYEIGVEDNGILAGLSEEELNDSMDTLRKMAYKLRASVAVLREREVQSHPIRKKVVEVLVRKVPDNQQFIDLRLAVLGNVDAGKSTLIGVLTQGELDNGHGRARLNLFRHLHEIQTGRTSSISHEILGFDTDGKLINYSSRTLEEICEQSSKLITLMDLCGHTKYQKTTVFGLTGYAPDFAMLLVSANTGMAATTKEHLGFALALGVPVFIVVSKVDMCGGAQLRKTIEQLEQILKLPGCNRIPLRVDTEDDAVLAASTFKAESTCPIFAISAVNGQGIDLLVKFLNVLPPVHITKDRELSIQELTEHQIDEVYSVPGVGPVVGGTVTRGTIQAGDTLLLGPNDLGQFSAVRVSTIHRNRLPCRVATAGQTACVALIFEAGGEAVGLRRGMVLLSPQRRPVACKSFIADVYLLFATRPISKGFQTVVHVGNVRQAAVIKDIIGEDHLTPHQRCLVMFEFFNRPEFIKPGTRLIFREGMNKGMGEVTKVFHMNG